MNRPRGFTLIEILTVLGSLAIIGGILFTVFKSTDIFKCSRDSQRIGDLNKLSTLVIHYLNNYPNADLDGGFELTGIDEASSSIYISVPSDKENIPTSTIINNKVWQIKTVNSDSSKKLDGNGWLPINFKVLGQLPINELPIDPLNSYSEKKFYGYVFNRKIRGFEINANLECNRFKLNGADDKVSNDGGDDPNIFEVGSLLTIFPSEIYGSNRLVGLKPQLGLSATSITINTPINTVSSTEVQISNLGSTTLVVYNIVDLNKIGRIFTDKRYLTVLPISVEKLQITCNGLGIYATTTVTTTLELWNNDFQQNPTSLNIICNLQANPRISVSPKQISIKTRMGSSASSSFVIYNRGSVDLHIQEINFYLEDSTSSCPNFVTSSNPASTIPPNGSSTVTITVDATSLTSKQQFTCNYYIKNDDPYRSILKVPIKITVPTKSTPPKNLTVSAYSSTSISLVWQEPTDNGYANISYYKIFRKENATPTSADFIASTTVTNYTNYGLTKGTNYCYRVSAVNEIGESDLSNVVCEIPSTVPNPPTLSAVAGNKKITLNWSVSDNGGSMINGYNVYASSSGTNGWKLLLEYYSSNSFEHTNLKLCNVYQYYVEAINRNGKSSPSNIATATPYGTSSSPQNLTASSTQNSIILNWQPPTDANCASLTQYNIYRATSTPSDFVLIATTSANSLSYTDTNIAANTTYYYQITAQNQYGESSFSNQVNAMISPTSFKCEPPSNLSITPGDKKNTLQWNSSPSLFDGDYYFLYVSTGTQYTKFATVTHPTTTYIHTGLVNGKTYYYYVTASGTSCTESNPSNIASSTPGSVPSAPTNIGAQNFVDKIILNWREPFSNGGYPILYYKIYKDDTFIATTSNLTYTDTNINSSQSYRYSVSAVNKIGEGEKASVLGGCSSWAQVLGMEGRDIHPYSSYLISQKYYLTVGNTYYYSSTLNRNVYGGLLIKTDLHGNIMWSKIYKHPNYSIYLSSLAELPDGDFIIAGDILPPEQYTKRVLLLMKVASTTGNVIWAKTIGGEGVFYYQYVIQHNGFLYLGASRLSTPRGIWIMKLDQNGNIIWSKIYDYVEKLSVTPFPILWKLAFDIQNNVLYVIYDSTYKPLVDTEGRRFYNYYGFILVINPDYGSLRGALAITNIELDKIFSTEFSDIKIATSGYITIAGKITPFSGDTNLITLKLYPDFYNRSVPYVYAYGFGTPYYEGDARFVDSDYNLYGGNTLGLGSGFDDILLIRLDIPYPYNEVRGILKVVTIGGEDWELLRSFNEPKSIEPNKPFLVGETRSVGPSYIKIIQLKLDDLTIRNSRGEIGFEPGTPFYFKEHPTSTIQIKDISKTLYWEKPNISVTDHTNFPISSITINSENAQMSLTKIAGCFASGVRPPSSPLNLQVTHSYPYNNLSWQPSSDNGGAPIIYYTIYRRIGNMIDYFPLNTSATTTYSDNIGNLTTEYCYRVTAVNSAGESRTSNTACIQPSPVPRITNLSVASGYKSNSLSWSYENSPTYFKVYRYLDNQYIFLASTTNNSYLHSNLQPGIEYCYSVTGVNAYGEGPYSNVVCGTPFDKPLPPQSLTVSVSNQMLILNWKPPINDGSSITEYRIYRKLIGESYPNSPYTTTSVSQLSYLDTNVIPGTTYCYVVTAKNSYGESGYSNEVCKKAGKVPGKFTLQITDYGQSFVNLSWNCSPGIDNITCNGGYPIIYYKIYKSTGGTYSLISTTTYNSFIDFNVTAGITYYYKVSAVNEIGEGPFSDPVWVTIPSSGESSRLDFDMYARLIIAEKIEGSGANLSKIQFYIYPAWKLDFKIIYGSPRYISEIIFSNLLLKNPGYLKIICSDSSFSTTTYLSAPSYPTYLTITVPVKSFCGRMYLFEWNMEVVCDPKYTRDYENFCGEPKCYSSGNSQLCFKNFFWNKSSYEYILHKDVLGTEFMRIFKDSIFVYR